MKVFSAEQIKKGDQYTLEKENIKSSDLMERAAVAAVKWMIKNLDGKAIFHIFCGKGNNGNDGFKIAELLLQKDYQVVVFCNTESEKASDKNLESKNRKYDFLDFQELKSFRFKENSVIIDALFGIGLNRLIDGEYAEIIQTLNAVNCPKIAVDIPSGLSADEIIDDNAVIFEADATLSFQFWKKTFFHPETARYCGKIYILDIGISKSFIEGETSKNCVIDEELIDNIYQPRNDFSHKGTYGKTTVVAGSFGKIGAAVLATKAALKSGSGITMTLAPKCGYEILQASCPEAMFFLGGVDLIEEITIEHDDSVGIGPGLGTHELTTKALINFLKNAGKPIVLDADALNILSKNSQNLNLIPKNSIITPHPKEFERLFGKTPNSFKRLNLAIKKAAEFQIFIVLKDHHTQIITPEGEVFYNITGNSGMAKGGSGDVLLGIITSLLAQNYSCKNAAVFGVWLHGKAGDFAAEKFSKEAMLPTDLIEELSNVFKNLK